ncbi:MAG: hypothetical protein IV085_06970 [Thiobacillus sp.]|nr:hypothetical protein [Thiobacillus sp.]
MKTPPFSVLKLSILLVLASLIAATTGLLWSWNQSQAASAALQRAHTDLDAARKQLDHSHQQKQLIVTHRDEYQALRSRGFIGDENRLAWIESVQQANRDAGLYGLDYRLTPRTPAPPELAQGLALGQTRMMLTFPILVETDLPRFLAALRQRAPGVFSVQTCRVSMPAGAEFRAVNLPRMQAECELLWFTVAEPNGGRP